VWTPISEEGSSDLERENESIRGFSRGDNSGTPMMQLTANSDAVDTKLLKDAASFAHEDVGYFDDAEVAESGRSVVEEESEEGVVADAKKEMDLNAEDKTGEEEEEEKEEIMEDKVVERNYSGTSQSSLDSGIGDDSICVS